MAMAFAASACLAPMPWAVRSVLIGVALLVSWSRIALGLHFPSDVLAAWCVGGASAWTVQALAQAVTRHILGNQRRTCKAPTSG
jgi:undecaprenyl-diphosphatase